MNAADDAVRATWTPGYLDTGAGEVGFLLEVGPFLSGLFFGDVFDADEGAEVDDAAADVEELSDDLVSPDFVPDFASDAAGADGVDGECEPSDPRGARESVR